MSDCTTCAEYDGDKGYCPKYCEVIRRTVEELISREAAIDAICKACSMEGDYHKCDGYPETSTWCDELVALRALPSAQSERTCVNCGRTANNGGWYADGRTRCPIEEHYALPKDGYCHLWEKRNVTDDDYPERRTDE